MMKLKKITALGDMSIEDAVNEFFKQENIGKTDIVHIKPVHANGSSGVNDIVAVYVFYDKYNER